MTQMNFKAFGNSDKYTNAPITNKNIDEVKEILNKSKSNKYTYHEWLTYESDIKPFYDIDFTCDNINNWSSTIMNQAKDILSSLYPDSSGIAICSSHGFKPDKNKHTVSYHMVVMGYNTNMQDLEKFNKMNNLYDININNTNDKLFDKSIYTNGRNFRSIYNYKPSDRERQKVPVNIQLNPEYHIIQSNEHTNKNSKKLIVDGIIESNNIIQEGEPIECAKCTKEELIKHIDNTKIIERMDNYDDWLTLGMICYNNFDGDDEGFKIWDKYSEQHSGYCGMIELYNKYKSFNNDRQRIVSYKRLIQWNVEDFPCTNPYEQHYKIGRLIEYMNDQHAFFLPNNGEYFTFREDDEILRQKKQAFVDYLCKYNFNIKNDKGEEQEIEPAKIWLKNRDRRDIERVVFKPNQQVKNNQYNLWTGYKYKNTGTCDLSKIEHVLDHLLNIWANGNKEVYDWIIGWFARIIQTPENKNAICLALYSFANGVGKNIILDLIRAIMGDKYFLSTSKDEQILGRFNSDVEGRILINMNETSILYDKKLSGPFKENITEKTISIERKGLTSYTIDNPGNYIITTNDMHMVSISGQDRRFNIIQCSDKKYNKEYYNKIADTDVQELANFLYNVDISDYDPRDFPRTELFYEQVELSYNNIESFVHKLIEGEECTYSDWYDEDAEDIVWLNKKQFYDDYVKTCIGYESPQKDGHFWRAIYKIFGKDNVQVRRGEFRLPPLELAQKMWDKYNGFKQQGKTGQNRVITR